MQEACIMEMIFMKDPLEILFQELTDTLEDTLPGTYWKDYRLRDRREDALLEMLLALSPAGDRKSGGCWRTTRNLNGTAPNSGNVRFFSPRSSLPGPFVRPLPPPSWPSSLPRRSFWRQASWLP